MLYSIKRILFALFLVIGGIAFSQYRSEYGAAIGGANYVGDVGGYLDYRKHTPNLIPLNAYNKFIRWNNPTLNVNFYYRYKINKRFSTSTHLSLIGLKATDLNNNDPFKVARNLSFTTRIIELIQVGEINFLLKTYMSKYISVNKGGKKRVDFRAYLFTGLGLIQFTPKAEFRGKVYKLRPLGTEDSVKYSPISWAVPLGIGISYSINKKYTIGLTYSYRFTGTDYIDDVSGAYKTGYLKSANSTYDNPNFLSEKLGNRTPEVQAYNSTDNSYNSELPTGRNFEKNAKRGSSTNKDGYFIANVSFGIILKGKNQYYKTKSKGLRNRKKSIKKKQFRAKF